MYLYHKPCFLRQKCFFLVHWDFHFDTLPLCFFVLILSSHSLVFVNTSNVLHVLNIWIEIFYSPNIVPVLTDPLMNSQVPVVHIKRSLEKQTNKYSLDLYVMSLVPLIASSRCHQWPVKKGRDVFKTTQTFPVMCKNKILPFVSTFQETNALLCVIYIYIYIWWFICEKY